MMYKLDIFSFLPVPRSAPVSTKASLIGSFLLLGIFTAYIIYSLICKKKMIFWIKNYNSFHFEKCTKNKLI